MAKRRSWLKIEIPICQQALSMITILFGLVRRLRTLPTITITYYLLLVSGLYMQ